MRKLILIDNYDSFTYNLFQILLSCPSNQNIEVKVIRNNTCSAQEIVDSRPIGIVISPGPGVPSKAGITTELLSLALEKSIPYLGICLGHQALAEYFGAKIIKAPKPIHGEAHIITHSGKSIFEGLPNPLEVMRYHSLIADPLSLSKDLNLLAWTAEGIPMAIRAEGRPAWGLQFHPESFASQCGDQLISKFLDELKYGN